MSSGDFSSAQGVASYYRVSTFPGQRPSAYQTWGRQLPAGLNVNVAWATAGWNSAIVKGTVKLDAGGITLHLDGGRYQFVQFDGRGKAL
jgi:hypothetical protein